MLLAKLRGTTQAELARRLDLKPSNLNHYLKGHSDIRASLFVRLLKELNIDIEDQLNRELAHFTDIAIVEKPSAGQALESIMKALGPQERKAMVSYLIKTVKVNLGNK